jgi:DNA-binding GntR family transcriptional regulator
MIEEPVIADINLALSAYERLRSMLFSGLIAGGQMIQERRLAESFGLSRTPLREALGRLEGEGLLRRDGRYLFCVSISVGDALEILSVRRSLEADATRAAALHMPDKRIAELRQAITGMTDPRDVTDDEHWAVDDLLHLSIAEASGNSLLARLIRDLRQRTRMFGLRRIPGRFSIGKVEHLAILAALEDRDAERAAQAMQLHIDHARAAIVAALTGTQ